MSVKYEGIIPPIVTPFTASGEIDEEKGQESLMDMLEKELEYIDDTIVDYQLNQLSKGVWIIKLDETSQIIQRIKDKLRNIFKNE